MSKSDDLGDRMKTYENCYKQMLTPNQDYIIRLDGRHFHSLAKGMEKPFDEKFIEVMRDCAKALLKEVQCAKMAYVQSDEISIYMTDKFREESQPYFNNNFQKIISVTASFCTMKFNELISKYYDKQGMFDSRIFMIPEHEVPNYFIWRQRDWEKNSLQMLTRAYYSSKEMHKKKGPDMHEMLHAKGVNWSHLKDHLKNGSFFIVVGRNIIEYNKKMDYQTIEHMIEEEGLEE